MFHVVWSSRRLPRVAYVEKYKLFFFSYIIYNFYVTTLWDELFVRDGIKENLHSRETFEIKLPCHRLWWNLPANACGRCWAYICLSLNTLRPRQNSCHFGDGILRCIFLIANVYISLKFSPKFASKVQVNNIPALVQKNILAPTRQQAIICNNDGSFTNAYMGYLASKS